MAIVRLTKRLRVRAQHHMALLLSTVLITAAFYFTELQTNVIAKLSMATAYASMSFFVVALVIGPFQILTGRVNAVSQDLRRDVGIWTAILAIAHTIAGLQVHFAGRMYMYFVFPQEEAHLLPIRYDLFGVANYTGLFATALFCYLLYQSTDASVRRLGLVRWKARQRLTYSIAFLLVLHGFIYQALEDREGYFVFIFVGLLVIAAVAQLGGYIERRRIVYKSAKKIRRKV